MPDRTRPPATGPVPPPLADLPLFADVPDGRPLAAAPRAQRTHATSAALAGRGAPPTAALRGPVPDPVGAAPALPYAVDWALVRAFRQQAADQLATTLQERDGLDEAGRHELGRSIILDLLTGHADAALTAGTTTFGAAEQQRMATAVFDALFGLGRLQPLVDDPDIENIEIRGCDQVHLVYADGRIVAGPPVADTDEELIEQLQFLASRSGGNERPFSPSNPQLHLRLMGGARLAATAWITPRPIAVIRLHRLTDIDLADLVERNMLSQGLADFLQAAVVAKKSIVVAGAQSSGKTTLLRALCNAIDPLESIGTMETEYELHLHEMPDRHPRCMPWEGRPGSGERGPDGRAAGEITLNDIVVGSLRFNLSRLIVGEVRGREVIPMFEAMQTGAGSLSTTHATSGRAAIERLVTCAIQAGAHVTETFAYRQVAEHIDLIVQITLEEEGTRDGSGGRRSRYVSEVVAVEPGERGQPAVTDVYRPGPDGRAVPGTLPQWLTGLSRFGFDAAGFHGQVAA